MKKIISLSLIFLAVTEIGAKVPQAPHQVQHIFNGSPIQQAHFGATTSGAFNTIELPGVMGVERNGNFILVEDLAFTAPASNDTIIEITSSNTTLDLNQLSVTSTRPAGVAGTIAIKVADGLRNVVIRNGKIQNVEGFGIVVGNGCQNVTIEDIYVESCDQGGIEIGTTCTSVSLERISSINHDHTAAAAEVFGIKLNSDCDNVLVSNCELSGNGGTKEGIGLWAEGVINCTVTSCDLSANSGINSAGARFVGGSSNKIENCVAKNNQVTTGATIGFLFENSTDNIVTSCEATNNKATVATGDAYGFASSGGTANKFENCTAVGQEATTGIATGFALLSEETLSAVIKCTSYGNRVSGAGQAYGIMLGGTGSNVTRCCVQDCNVKANRATVAGAMLAGLRDFSADCTTLIAGNLLALNGDRRLNLGSAPDYDIDPADLTINAMGKGGLNLFLNYADSKNVADIIVESDISNLQAYSTALFGMTNILIVPLQED